MESRIRVRVGGVEVECEGTAAFVQSNFDKRLTRAIELLNENPGVADSTKTTRTANKPPEIESEASTAQIATIIGGKTGPELALAAAAHLTLVRRKQIFTRNELLEEMKSATPFYTQSHRKNLSAIIQKLQKDRSMIGRTNNTYAMSVESRDRISRELAE